MQKPKTLKAEVKSVKRVYDSYFKIDEYIIEAERHNGGTALVRRYIFERGHSVAIIAYDPKRDSIVLLNQLSVGAVAANDHPFDNTLPEGSVWQA